MACQSTLLNVPWSIFNGMIKEQDSQVVTSSSLIFTSHELVWHKSRLCFEWEVGLKSSLGPFHLTIPWWPSQGFSANTALGNDIQHHCHQNLLRCLGMTASDESNLDVTRGEGHCSIDLWASCLELKTLKRQTVCWTVKGNKTPFGHKAIFALLLPTKRRVTQWNPSRTLKIV